MVPVLINDPRDPQVDFDKEVPTSELLPPPSPCHRVHERKTRPDDIALPLVEDIGRTGLGFDA